MPAVTRWQAHPHPPAAAPGMTKILRAGRGLVLLKTAKLDRYVSAMVAGRRDEAFRLGFDLRRRMSGRHWQTMGIKEELLEILVCPQCKGDIHLKDDQSGLICETCRLVYAIKDDIPIMLVDEALPLDS